MASAVELDRRFVDMPPDMHAETVYHFSVRELEALAEIDGWGDVAHCELNRRFTGQLEKFKLPVTPTKKMMEDRKAIISGSVALYICNPGPWLPTDLDFYCPEGELDGVVDFLKRCEYEVVPEDLWKVGGTDLMEEADEPGVDAQSANGSNHGYHKHVLKTVVTMQKAEDGLKLNVIESILPCAEAPIFCFHSTVVMNAVTSKGVICYYPEWTLQGKGVINRASGLVAWNDREQNKEQDALAKYRDRGYEIFDDCGELHEGRKAACVACRPMFSRWNQGISMTFDRGDTFRAAGRLFCWRLGQRPSEMEKIFWRERGATILVQGNGDGRAFLYDGCKQTRESLGRREALGNVGVM